MKTTTHRLYSRAG